MGRQPRGDTRLTLGSGADLDGINAPGRGTWGRIEAGVGGNKGPGPILSGWVDLGDVKGLGVRAGFRF